MKEVLNLHIGQAGTQLGHSYWELLCAEHGVTENGALLDVSLNDKLESYFSLNNHSKYIPRCLFVDLEPTVIDEIRSGGFRKLFHPDRLMTGPEDAASNFARGFFTIGKLLLGKVNLEVRHMFEASNCVQGIMLFRSLGGGTGAGLTSAIFDGLSEYPKTPKIDIPIYPSPTICSSTVEPYNSVLAEHFCMEDVDVGLLFDNEALYELCTRYLSVTQPSHPIINRLVSQLCSSITASIRFENTLNCDITVLQTNLVPYPRIHFPLCNFAPVCPPSKMKQSHHTVHSVTRAVFERDNQLMKVDPTYGRFMSCALFYRGLISPQDVHSALQTIKRDRSIDFVEWCPTGFKVGINTSLPVAIPNGFLASPHINVAMLTNSSAIGQAWQRLTHKFYLLYAKRSFLHWFVGEGMEECEFTEALYNISTLVKDYQEVIMDSVREESVENFKQSTHLESINSKVQSIKSDNPNYQKAESEVKLEESVNYRSMSKGSMPSGSRVNKSDSKRSKESQRDNYEAGSMNYKESGSMNHKEGGSMNYQEVENPIMYSEQQEQEYKKMSSKGSANYDTGNFANMTPIDEQEPQQTTSYKAESYNDPTTSIRHSNKSWTKDSRRSEEDREGGEQGFLDNVRRNPDDDPDNESVRKSRLEDFDEDKVILY